MAGREAYRQQLDAALANVASVVRSTLGPDSDAGRLARWLAATSQEVLEAPVPQDAAVGPPGFGYTTDEAYEVKLFGQGLLALIGAAHGETMAALTPPVLGSTATAGLDQSFTGLD